jgi:signal transduction histidine kinase
MKKILVIDDDELLRDLVKTALSDRGYDVIEADNGSTGIELARRELPDLVLCDVLMDRVDGYLTLSTLRNEPATASIPFILITGMADATGMRHGMELGADDYLPKPFTMEGLYAAVDARLKKAQTARDEAEKKLSSLRDNISLMLPHEMRTPLNGIIGYAELLQDSSETLSPAEIADMGQTMLESGKRLNRLVENFLAYVELEIAAADPEKAASMCRQTTPQALRIVTDRARLAAAESGRGQDLSLTGAETVAPLSKDNLARLVDELVQNAFKFSTAGTPVTVSFSETPVSVTLSINDRGCGLTAEEIASIGAYVQFGRKSREQQGAGLGLVIAKRITELHGGILTIASDSANGTTVTVKVPRLA